jgi:MFS family permease
VTVKGRLKKVESIRALRHRNFRVLYPASVLSNTGTWAQRIAQDWLVLQLTHSPLALGVVTALQFAPTLVFSTVGGVLADRFEKRKLLFLSNAAQGLIALLLGLLVVNHSVNIWHVYVLAFALGIFSAIDAPVRQTFTSELVPVDDVPNAITLNSINFNIGRLIGPGISGILISLFGTGPSFLINAASYLTFLFALSFIRPADLNIQPKPKEKVKLAAAFRYLGTRKDLRLIILIVFMAATFGMNYQIFNALMATQAFHLGATEFGGLGTFLAIGSLTGAMLSSRLERFRKPRYISLGATLFGLSLVMLSFSPTYGIYSILIPIGGLMAIMTFIAANTYVQTTTTPAMRGRVIGIYMMVMMGGTPIGSPLIGWVSEVFGIRVAVFGCGAVTALVSFACWLFLRSQNSRRALPGKPSEPLQL